MIVNKQRDQWYIRFFLILIWNKVLVVDVAGALTISGTAARLVSIPGLLNISDIMQFFDHGKSNFISKLIKMQIKRSPKITQIF